MADQAQPQVYYVAFAASEVFGGGWALHERCDLAILMALYRSPASRVTPDNTCEYMVYRTTDPNAYVDRQGMFRWDSEVARPPEEYERGVVSRCSADTDAQDAAVDALEAKGIVPGDPGGGGFPNILRFQWRYTWNLDVAADEEAEAEAV